MSFVVTIDGPAAAGKSTTARAAAARLGFLYLDSGALYRAIALKVMESGVPPHDPAAVERCLADTHIELSGSAERALVRVDGLEVSEAIRTPAVSELASRLAAMPAVRMRLSEIQRDLAEEGPAVAEGRDLGTVVFPGAQVKIYLDADLETRVGRRHRELKTRGIPTTLEQVREDLERRDARDRERSEAPLRPALDAIVVDTSGMEPDTQVEAVLSVVRRHPQCPLAGKAAAGRPGVPGTG